MAAKVRHGLLHLTLDVPDDTLLLDWGTAAHKPLDGHVTFFETDRRTARETVSFAGGACVGYHEVFAGGNAGAGAYECQLTIAVAKLVLTPGVAAATPRDYAAPLAAAPLPAALATLPELNRQQRYNKRMSLMSNAQGKLAVVPDTPARPNRPGVPATQQCGGGAGQAQRARVPQQQV